MMKSYFEIAQEVVKEGNARLTKKKKRRQTMLFCMAVIVLTGAVAAVLDAHRQPKPLAEATSTVESVTDTTDTQTTQPHNSAAMLPMLTDPQEDTTVHLRPLIRAPESQSVEKYMAPRPGQHIVTYPLGDAIRAHAGEDVTYYIRFQAISHETMTAKELEAFYRKESERMSDDRVGMTVEVFTDADGKAQVTFSALMWDPSFLDDFPDNPDCGYFISLYDEESCVK